MGFKRRQSMKKLLTNSKSNVVRNLGLALLLITTIVMATSCKKDDPEPTVTSPTNTCETEQNNLNNAIASENGLNNTFNVNADSCIHYWAPQMPEAFLNAAYGNLPNIATPPYTTKDSVSTLNNYASAVPAQYQDEKVKGIIRTSGSALTAWDSYLNAQAVTQAAQTALTECQNSND